MEGQTGKVAVGDPKVHLGDECRAHVVVREVVPAFGNDAGRGPPELAAKALIQHKEEVTQFVARDDVFADRVGSRDERRAVAAGIPGAHGTISSRHRRRR